MKQVFSISVLSGLLFVCLVGFQNCSQVSFTPDEAASAAIKNSITGDSTNSSSGPNVTNSGDDANCRVDLINSTKNVKVLFLIDTSGSNASINGGPGTDVGKVWRLSTINSFISAYGSKPNFEFGFATFQGTSASALITSNMHGIFTKNPAEVSQAISDFKNIKDEGNTPYDAALAIVRDMINYDQQRMAAKDVGYVVVMVSDGSPTNTSYTDSRNGMTNLTNDVNKILAEAPGQISLNTVYLYNQAAPTASQKAYLQKISSLGSGAFIEASSNQTVQISDTVQVPKTVCN